MKRVLLALGISISLLTFLPQEASALVCVRGVYRAGCFGVPIVRRGFYYGGGGVYRGGFYRGGFYRGGYARGGFYRGGFAGRRGFVGGRGFRGGFRRR